MPIIASIARSFSKRTIILFVVLSASAAWLLQCSLTETEEDKLEDKLLVDLKLISDGKSPTDFINSYDLICFTFNTNISPHYSLLENSKLKDPELSGKCKRSTLLSSLTYPPVIGLVKDNYIQCIGITKFEYWGDVQLNCVPPSKLRAVSIKSAPLSGGFNRPGPGNQPPPTFQIPNFQIMEKQ